MRNTPDFEPKVRRLTKRRRATPSSTQEVGFLAHYGVDLALVGGFILGVLILTSPWHNLFPPSTLVIGGLLLVAVFVTTMFRLRRHLLQSSWFNELAPCPNCGHVGLKRTPRHEWQRFLARLTGLPIRRYICPQCTYKVLRLDNSKSQQ